MITGLRAVSYERRRFHLEDQITLEDFALYEYEIRKYFVII